MKQLKESSKNEIHNQKLIIEHIEYAKSIARKTGFKQKGCALEESDIEAQALLGLCIAGNRYDKTSKAKFSSYSYMRIRGSILDGHRAEKRILNLSRSDRALGSKKRDKQKVSQKVKVESKVGQFPDFNEQLGVVYKELPGSSELVASYKDDCLEEKYLKREREEAVMDLISTLSKEERKLVKDLYFKGKTMAEVSRKTKGASTSTINRRHKALLKSLRVAAERAGYSHDDLH